jgi:NADPH:quinone reductase-like Zn-dependent oxidoreductase
MAAVQLARAAGAHVTGVCSTGKIDLVRSLGAEQVIDYTQEDFTQRGETYDLIFDVLGRSSFARCQGSLKPGGCYLLASFKGKQLVQMLGTRIVGGKKVICALAPEKTGDLPSITELIEAGKLQAPIDRCFPLEQITEAHRYVEAGHAQQGKVAITVARNDTA